MGNLAQAELLRLEQADRRRGASEAEYIVETLRLALAEEAPEARPRLALFHGGDPTLADLEG
jgi:hypothetical protein